jgi:hypothetical protein
MDELRLREDWSQRLFWVVSIHTVLIVAMVSISVNYTTNKPSSPDFHEESDCGAKTAALKRTSGHLCID